MIILWYLICFYLIYKIANVTNCNSSEHSASDAQLKASREAIQFIENSFHNAEAAKGVKKCLH